MFDRLESSALARLVIAAAVSLTLLAMACAVHAAQPLPALTIDKTRTSVSGMSSGGYMAVQLHVAYSDTFKTGAGVVAGGPFYCAEGSVGNATGRCMAHDSGIPVPSLVTLTKSWVSSGYVDPVDNLQSSKLYLFSGTVDSVVHQPVMNDLLAYYQAFVPAGNIVYKKDIAAEHSMVTEDYGSGCSTKGSPYIDDCDFDLAGAILQQLYGPLNPRNNGTLGGSFIEFDQSAFISGHGMAAKGWAYVPQACATGTSCKLHVVLHGCQQNVAAIGEQYVRNTGYNRWADTNGIVLLYPQTSSSAVNGCWDWWGYDNAAYARKSGPQMAAIKAMVDRVSGEPVPPATCFTASNYEHTLAGHAYAWFGLTYANGSNAYMGWWSTMTSTTLKQTEPNYYVVGSCPKH